ncbi:unnamed protein product [Linum tenue]|uniref:Uncharacterized protein n=1 Tax=Linum tenue TaxID=586396 RepID=A0AAV0H8R6_9ROSI|nr:unnamed protein product [Linum tenue]
MMECLVSQDEVYKVIFQTSKDASWKAENCLQMAKSVNCFVKTTLKLNLRSMDLIQVKSLPQHESRYVYLPREGIG